MSVNKEKKRKKETLAQNNMYNVSFQAFVVIKKNNTWKKTH